MPYPLPTPSQAPIEPLPHHKHFAPRNGYKQGTAKEPLPATDEGCHGCVQETDTAL